MNSTINYTLINSTTLSGALQDSANSLNAVTGFEFFFIFIWFLFFFGGAIISSRYGQSKSILYACFIADMAAFFLVAAGVLNPIVLVLAVIFTLPWLFLSDGGGT